MNTNFIFDWYWLRVMQYVFWEVRTKFADIVLWNLHLWKLELHNFMSSDFDLGVQNLA